jgi:alpha-L-fucosidase 2
MKYRSSLLAVGLMSVTLAASAEKPLTLWHDHPATNWERETLPLGNGRLGATAFGGIEKERIVINEQSLWSGWPEPGNDRADSFAAPEQVRVLLREGKYAEASGPAME